MAPGRGPLALRASVERGQVILIVALGLVVLVGAVGLAIDGGRLFLERRDAQGAADHAAITAAVAFCTDGDTPAAAAAEGVESAALNGFDNDSPTVVASVTPEAENRFHAEITSSSATAFMQVLGIDTFEVTAEAVARCIGSGGPGPGAVFAGGDTCNSSSVYTFHVSAGGQRVYGGVHANDDVYIDSKPNWWTDDGAGDPFTYAGTLVKNESPIFYPTGSTSNNVFQQASPAPGYPRQQGPPRAWPGSYGPTDVPARLAAYKALAQKPNADDPNNEFTYVNGDLSNLTDDGLYYVTGKVDVSSVSSDLDVTLVAEGSIKLSASSWALSPFQDGLLAFSALQKTGDKVCDEFTVALSGGSTTWNGIIWAPGGLVEMSGSSDATLNGTIISWAVRMNGQNLSIKYDGSLFGGPNGPVFLSE